MKKILIKGATFFRAFGGCLSRAWRDSDLFYNIPKSRFCDRTRVGGNERDPERKIKRTPRNAFVGSFRDCVARAWDAADSQYYLPKSRFADPEHKRSAYKTRGEHRFWSALGRFPATLVSCISMAWKASDILNHLPKSSYQDREFINGLMNSVPRPSGKVVIQPFRPFTVEFGVVGEDGTMEGWTVGLADKEPDRDFFITDEMVGSHGKPEIEV